MKLLLSIITAYSLIFNNVIINKSIENDYPKIIDAYILAYDAMYSQSNNSKLDYIILDMSSYFFADTTYNDREKMINYFNKYDKVVLNSSLFNLKEIGLADNFGNLKLNGRLLMIECINISSDSGIIIKAIDYKTPISANFYTIKLDIENNKWVLKSINLDGVS